MKISNTAKIVVVLLMFANLALAKSSKRSEDFVPTTRLAAWHETMVRSDETVPNTAVVTYKGSVVQSYLVSKLMTYAKIDGELITPKDATDLVVNDFPGGITATYKLGKAEITATNLPLMVGRETDEKDGAALYRVRANKRCELVVECGPSFNISNNFSTNSYIRTEDFKYVENESIIVIDGKTAFVTDPDVPYIVGIHSQSPMSIENDSAKGKYVKISGKGKMDVVVAYGETIEAVKKIIPGNNNKELKAVKKYYSKLLESKIETPETKMNEAFRSAIYNLEYTWLKPYGWVECLSHWHAVWHQQHTRGLEWLGQEERSKKCIEEQAKLIFDNNQIPNIHVDGKGFLSFGGTNQYFTWEARKHFEFTNDLEFAQRIAKTLDRVLEGTFDRDDPDGNLLFEWGLQIGNQEDFVATPHDGTSSTIEVINMMKTRAEIAQALGDLQTAKYWRNKAEISQFNMRKKLWMPNLGRYGYFIDPQGEIRPDGQYHTLLYPAIWDIVDPLDKYSSIRHLRDRLMGEDGEVYCSNNFPQHYNGTWGMQAGCAQQPWGAWGLSKVGLRNEAWRPLNAVAQWVMCKNLRGSWPEIAVEPTPAYFSPPAGLYVASVIEAIFGLCPDMPNDTLTISPSFPDHWPNAKLTLPKYNAKYQRRGNKIEYVVSSEYKAKHNISWKLPPCEIKTFKINGKKVNYTLSSGVDYIELNAQTRATNKSEIVLEFSELDYEIHYPRSIAEGENFKLEIDGLKIVGVDDRYGILSNYQLKNDSVLEGEISEGYLDEYLKFGRLGQLNFSRRTLFIECENSNGIGVTFPIDLTILPRCEIVAASEAKFVDGKIQIELEIRNNTQEQLSGEAQLLAHGNLYPFNVEIAPRSQEKVVVSISKKYINKFSPGDNALIVSLPNMESIDIVVVMNDLFGMPEFAISMQDRFEPLSFSKETKLLKDTQWPTLRVMQGQPHLFVAWHEWNQPLKSLADKDSLKIPEIPELDFEINQREFVPISRKIDKTLYRQRFDKDEYKKFYFLLLPLVDNHDMFTEVARINVYRGIHNVYSKVLTYPGDVDFLDPNQENIGGTVRGRKTRFGLLPQLQQRDSDWLEAKPPAFVQTEYWSSAIPVLLNSGTLTVVEVDLGRSVEADSISFEILGEYSAFGILGIVAEKSKDISARTLFMFNKEDQLNGWTLEGNAFSVKAIPHLFVNPTLNSLAIAGEKATGKAISPAFTIQEGDESLEFKYQGGKTKTVDGEKSLVVKVIDSDSGEVIDETSMPNTHTLVVKKVSLKKLLGRSLRIEIIDNDPSESYAWNGIKSVKIKMKSHE